jgi:hypothetical protein
MSTSPSKFRLLVLCLTICYPVLAGCATLDGQTVRGTPHVYAEVVNETPNGVTVLERQNESLLDRGPIQTAISEVEPENKYRKNISEAEYRQTAELLDTLPTDNATTDRWGGQRGFYVKAEVGIVRISVDTIVAG